MEELPQWKKGDIAYRSMPETFRNNKWNYKANGPFKIMGIINNYAMCRLKGYSPFVVWHKDLKQTAEECIYIK